MTPGGSKTGSDRTDHSATNKLILLHVGVLALGIVVQHVVQSFSVGGGQMRTLSVVVALVAFAATLGACTKKSLFDAVASARFGVVSLTTLTLLSILGTVVLQGESDQVMETTYGSIMPLLRLLFIDDLFHSFGFAALLGMASAALVATVFAKRRLTLKRYGVIGAHLGCVVALAGTAVGSVWGVKGRLNLHVQEESDSFYVQDDQGQIHQMPLGFTVRLDEFQLLKYEPAFRLRIFEMSEDGQKMVASFDPTDEKSLEKLRDRGVEVVGYWPDFQSEMEVNPAPEPTGGQPRLAAVSLQPPGDGSHDLWLLDQGTPEGGRLRGTQDTAVTFIYDQVRAQRLLSAIENGTDTPHVVVAGSQRINVEVGKTYPLPDDQGSFRVLAAFKDFVIDPDTKKPAERSGSPNNPALQVEIKDPAGTVLATQWLFANFPSFNHDKEASGPDLRYVFEGKDLLFDQGIILVGEPSEVWTVQDGKLTKKTPLEVGGVIQVDGTPLKVVKLLPSASVRHINTSRSDRAENPVAEVRVGDVERTNLIGPGQAVELDEDLVLALTPKGDDVRDYLSTLSVLHAGQEVLSRKVEVNHPLKFGGFAFYQSDYDPNDATFSGFQVVKDPGLPLVYLGLVMMILAVAHVYMVVPVVRRLRRRAAGPERPQQKGGK